MSRRHSELLGKLFDESQGDFRTPTEASRAAPFARACQVISLEFGNPELTPGAIARDVGVSSRALARAFAANHETVTRCVFEERVRQAARLLASRGSAHRTVAAIAFACGFNDLSHFGRVFSSKMHMTPTEWRRRGATCDVAPVQLS